MTEFEQLLHALTLGDNTVRNRAESVLEEMKSDPDTLFGNLLQVAQNTQDTTIRSLSSVLLRRLISVDNPPLLPKCSEAAVANLRDGLVAAIQRETVPDIRRKLVDTTSELAIVLLPDNLWPLLMPKLFEWVTKGEATLQEIALQMFEQLAEYIASNMRPHFSTIGNVFKGCMMGTEVPGAVKIAAVRAAGTLLVCFDRGASCLKEFGGLANAFFIVVNNFVSSNDIDRAKHSISVLIDVADHQPTFFRTDLHDALNVMLTIASRVQLPDDIRRLALEFIVALAEGSPTMVRKAPHNTFVRQTLPVIFNMMLEHKEDLGWATREESEESDPKSNVSVAKESLERLGTAIGHKKFIPIMLPFVAPFLQNNDWRYRYAAIAGLTQVSDSVVGTEQELLMLAKQIAPSVQDDNERVRYEAVTAIGMYCCYKGPVFQRATHELVMPALVQGLQDSCMRVRSQSAASVVNFAQSAPAEVLSPYVDRLVQLLYLMLREGGRTSKEWSLTAISAIGETATDAVAKLYTEIMPVLRDIIQATPEQLTFASRDGTTTDLRLMRGKAVECASVLAVAVGRERFSHDAPGVIEALLNLNATASDSDDPARSYLWQAWARIASVLPAEFSTYLPTVLPSLLHGVKTDTEYRKLSGEEAAKAREALAEMGDDDDDEYEFVEEEDGLVRVKNSALEDKTMAANTLSSLCTDLKQYFKPYVQAVMDVLAPLLDLQGQVFEDLRLNTVAAMPALISAASYTDNDAAYPSTPNSTGLGSPGGTSDSDQQIYVLKNLLERALRGLLPALPNELNMDIILAMLASVRLCVDEACKVRRPEETSSTPTTPAANGASSIPSTPTSTHSGSGTPGLLDNITPLGLGQPETYRPLLEPQALREITQTILTTHKKSIQRRSVLIAEVNASPDDFDDEAKEEQEARVAQEEDMQSTCMEVLGGLLKTHPHTYLEILRTDVAPVLSELVREGASEGELRAGIFLIDDILEFGGSEGAKYWDGFKSILIRGCGGEGIALRQAAAYGLGAAAENCGELFAPSANEVIKTLRQLADSISPGDDDAESVHDNAISAVGKIIQCQGSAPGVNLGSEIGWWLSKLPLHSDAAEGRVCMQILCARLESGCAHVFGQNCSNLPHILAIMAEVVSDDDLSSVALAARFKHCLIHLQKSLPNETWLGAVQNASPPTQAVLHELMT